MLIRLVFFVGLYFLHCSCSNPRKEDSIAPVFELIENSGINFTNQLKNSPDFNIFSYRNFYNGGGCAIGDLNNDGLADVYFTANQGNNKLYLNKGNFSFEDITEKAGVGDSLSWSTGVALVDINADGWLDIYVCNAGFINNQAPQSRLFINNHDLSFTEQAAKYNLENSGGYATHAAFFDYDNDGDLDCFIVNNSFIPTNTLNYENKRNLRAKDWPVKHFLKGGGDRLFKNNKGRFEDVSEVAGIYGSLISFGLGVTVGDINNDGWLDIYVSNDFFERDYLYINQRDGSFKDSLTNYLQHISHSSMGADMADVNNDGLPDIFTTEMLPDDNYRLKTTSTFENIDVNRQKVKSGFFYQYMQNTLQVNNGNGKFYETAFYSGVAASDWSWGGLIFDADNNGLPDIFVCNGIYKDVTDQDFIDFFADELYQRMALSGEKAAVDQLIDKMPSNPIANKMFANTGELKFQDKAAVWGMATPSFSNGAAYGDLDNDGDLDLIVNNVNQPGFVYKNTSTRQSGNHFFGLALIGNDQNTFAVGSKVKLYLGKEILTRELIPTRGFQSSVDYKIIMGIGNASTIDSVVIIWPNRSYSIRRSPGIDTVETFIQPKSAPAYDFTKPQTPPVYFMALPTTFDKHQEDDYVDFYTERNIPVMLSREGPKMAIADVNADGLDDIYICSGAGSAGQLYLQSKDGAFLKRASPAFEADAGSEGICALFFDADNDGDMDLVVGNGGNNWPVGSEAYKTHLYLNNGSGHFSAAAGALPSNGFNTGAIAANDFDKDGDIDLFMGSRSVPGAYGETPGSRLLLNDGKGNFSEVAIKNYPNIATVGLVTSAVWSKLDKSTDHQLVVVGEWMAPKIFSFNGKAFIEQQTNLQQMFGLWQTVSAVDVDGDGDEDLIFGNIGQNFYLQPGVKAPVKLWISDFDNNGTTDKIITNTVNGGDLPVFTKRELTEQMPSLKKQNLQHADYANKSISSLFSSAAVEKAEMKQFNYASSCIAINNGNGNFTIQQLPWQVQLSCINAILPTDINGDGKTDLLIGGNKYDFLPQFGRLDANFGTALLNDGKGNFTIIPNRVSGINIEGCVKEIKIIKTADAAIYIWLRNNEFPVMYKKSG